MYTCQEKYILTLTTLVNLSLTQVLACLDMQTTNRRIGAERPLQHCKGYKIIFVQKFINNTFKLKFKNLFFFLFFLKTTLILTEGPFCPYATKYSLT